MMDKQNPKDEVQKPSREVEEKKETGIEETINPLNSKEKVQKLLLEAREIKGKYIEEAIDLLLEAEKLLPDLISDDVKGSERNLTQGKDNKEILYFSKRGNILYELKNYEEAAFCYQAIKERLPNNVQVYKSYGDCLRKLGQYEMAIKQYSDGLRIDKKLDSPAATVTAGLLNSKGLAYLRLTKYQEALKEFEAAIQIRRKNPLYHCNSGHAAYALGEKEKALEYFNKARELINSTRKGEMTAANISYIQEKTQQFIQELKDLEEIPLKVDSFIDTREQQFVENGIEALSAPINAQEGPENVISRIIDQGPQLRKTKEKLKLIQEDPILNQFYDGLMFTLHQSYANAVIVLGGKLEIKKSGNTVANTFINLISLLPGIGSQLSKGVKAVQEFVETDKIRKSAANVCSFETTQLDFDSTVQDVLCEVIFEKKTELNVLNDANLSEQKVSNWTSWFTNLADSIGESKNNLEQRLYGERNRTFLQKLGYQTATILVSDYIASGEIYGGVDPIMVSRSEKRTRLTEIVRKVIEQSLKTDIANESISTGIDAGSDCVPGDQDTLSLLSEITKKPANDSSPEEQSLSDHDQTLSSLQSFNELCLTSMDKYGKLSSFIQFLEQIKNKPVEIYMKESKPVLSELIDEFEGDKEYFLPWVRFLDIAIVHKLNKISYKEEEEEEENFKRGIEKILTEFLLKGQQIQSIDWRIARKLLSLTNHFSLITSDQKQVEQSILKALKAEIDNALEHLLWLKESFFVNSTKKILTSLRQFIDNPAYQSDLSDAILCGRFDKEKFKLNNSLVMGEDGGLYLLLNRMNEQQQNAVISEKMVSSDYLQDKIKAKDKDKGDKIVIGTGSFGTVRFALSLLRSRSLPGEIVCVKKTKSFQDIDPDFKRAATSLELATELTLGDYFSNDRAQVIYSPFILDMALITNKKTIKDDEKDHRKGYVMMEMLPQNTATRIFVDERYQKWEYQKPYLLDVLEKTQTLLESNIAMTNLKPQKTLYEIDTRKATIIGLVGSVKVAKSEELLELDLTKYSYRITGRFSAPELSQRKEAVNMHKALAYSCGKVMETITQKSDYSQQEISQLIEKLTVLEPEKRMSLPEAINKINQMGDDSYVKNIIFSHYISKVKDRLENKKSTISINEDINRTEKLLIPLKSTSLDPLKYPNQKTQEDLFKKIDDFLVAENSKQVMAIFGVAGSGKSITLQLKFMQAVKSWQPGQPLPIYFDLANGLDLDQILRTLNTELGTNLNLKDLDGQHFYIDSFDKGLGIENKKETLIKEYFELIGSPKILITCRTDFLQDNSYDWFSPESKELEVCYLAPINCNDCQNLLDMIERYVSYPREHGFVQHTAQDYLNRLKELQLIDLINTGFTFFLIMEVLFHLPDKKERRLNKIDIYATYISHYQKSKVALLKEHQKNKLEEMIPLWKSNQQQDLCSFATELGKYIACQMHLKGQFMLSQSDEPAALGYDSSLLLKHQSIIQMLKLLPLKIVTNHSGKGPISNQEVNIGFMNETIKNYYLLEAIKSEIESHGKSKILTSKSIVSDSELVKLIVLLMKDNPNLTDSFLNAIENSKHDKSVSSIIYASNSISLLVAAKHSFSGFDLENIAVKGTNIVNGIFHNARLDKADLSGVDMTNVNLKGTSLNGAEMKGVKISVLPDLIGHAKYVYSVSFSSDGESLASGSADCTIKIWNPSTGECLQTLNEHANRVESVSFSPVGKSLASGSADCTIKIWNPSTGECVMTLNGHTNGIKSVSFSPDGKFLASGAKDQTIKIWDPSTGECVKTLNGHTDRVNSISFSPDGEFLASGSSDQTIKIWDLSTGECLQTLNEHNNGFESVSFSPDGEFLASGAGDRTIKIWNPSTGKCLQTLNGHTLEVISVSFSPDGEFLASGSSDQTIKIWNPSTGKCLQTLNGHTLEVFSVSFSPDSKFLASGSWDKTIKIWNPYNGESQQTLNWHSTSLVSVTFSELERSDDTKAILFSHYITRVKDRLKNEKSVLSINEDIDKTEKLLITLNATSLDPLKYKNLPTEDLFKKMDDFLDSENKKQVMAIFGVAGSGKSIALQLKFIQAVKAWQPGQPLPIYFNLANGLDLDRIVMTLNTELGINLSLKDLDGQHLYIDSFDEGLGIEDKRETLIKEYFELIGSPKILITCRTDYLEDSSYEWFSPKSNKDLEVWYLAPINWEESQNLPDMIEKHVNYSKEHSFVQHTAQDYLYRLVELQLTDLINTGFMFFLIMDVLFQLPDKKERRISKVDIYATYISHYQESRIAILKEDQKKKLEEMIPLWRSDQQLDLCSFATELGKYIAFQIHFEGHFRVGESDKLASLGYDSCVLFKHQSINHMLKLLPTKIVTTHSRKRLISNQQVKIGFIHETIKNYYLVEAIKSEIESDSKSLILASKSIVHDSELMKLIVLAMKDNPKLKTSFLQAIENSKHNKSAPSVIYASNSISLLVAAKHSFSGWDLRNIAVKGANIGNGLFCHARLDNSDLSGVDMSNVNLKGASLNEVDMRGVSFSIFPDLIHHNDKVTSVSFSPDSKFLASGSEDKTVKIWNPSTGECVKTLIGHIDGVKSVIFFNEMFLASGSSDRTIKIWNPSTGECIKTLNGHTDGIKSVSFSPDGKFLASGAKDQTIKIWDPSTGECVKTLNGHTDRVNSISFSPDGKFLASGSGDKTIKIWDPSTAECLQTLNGHTLEVFSVSFSPDSKFLASGAGDRTIKIWNPSSSKCLQTSESHIDSVNSISFSPDGKFLASGSGDKTINIWDPSTGECLGALDGHASEITSVSFSPDGKFLASGSWDSTLKIWNQSACKCLQILNGHETCVKSVNFSYDGKFLASGSMDQTIKVWNPSNGECLQILNAHNKSVESVSFSLDSKFLASGSSDEKIKIWDPITGVSLQTLDGHTSEVTSVNFSSDGKFLASGSFDEKIKIWDPSTSKCLKTFNANTSSISFSLDGKFLASGLWQKIKIWNPNTGEHLQTLTGHTNKVNSVSFSRDGKYLASGSQDKIIKIWNSCTWEVFQILRGHTSGVTSVSFSHNGKYLASGSSDQTIKIWDLSTFNCLQTLNDHTDCVTSVSFSPVSDSIASASRDASIKIFELQSTANVWLLKFNITATPSTFLADGASLKQTRISNSNKRVLEQKGAETQFSVIDNTIDQIEYNRLMVEQLSQMILEKFKNHHQRQDFDLL